MRAAATQQAELAAVRKAVDNTGAAWVTQGKTVTQVLEEEAARSGFLVTELGQGFIRIESGIKNTARSFSLLHDAEDIARARHLGLAQASVILARAAQGSDTALRRLGIIIPKLSTNVAELEKRHNQAIASGIKFTAAQNQQHKSAVAVAAALDKQANQERVIAQIRARFGGQSGRFANTAAGQFARFHEAEHELAVSIGTELLPALSGGAEGARHFFDVLRESGGLRSGIAGAVGGIRDVFIETKHAAELLAPPLEIVAHAVADVAHVAGAGGILAFAVGFKAVAVATSVAAGVEARYTAILAAGQGERVKKVSDEEAAAIAANAHSAAVAAQTIALEANTAALVANNAATVAGVAATAEAGAARLAGAAATATAGNVILASGVRSVASDAEVAALALGGTAANVERTGAAAAGAGSRLAMLGRGLFALSGGMTTLGAVAAGAAAFGIYKLVTADSAAESANKRLRSSLDELDSGLARSASLARSYATAVDSIKSDRVAIQTAKANLALAEQALATSTAAHGSAEYASALAEVASAQDSYERALRSLSAEEGRAAGLRRARIDEDIRNEERRRVAITKTLTVARAFATQEAAIARRDGIAGKAGAPPPRLDEQQRAVDLAGSTKAASEFADALDKDAQKLSAGQGPLRRQIEALAEFTRVVGRIPSERQVRIVLDASSAREGMAGLVGELERAKPAVGGFVAALDLEAAQLAKSNPELSARLVLLADYARAVGAVPTRRETELALKTGSFKGAVTALAEILAQMQRRASEEGFASGQAFADAFAAGERGAGGGVFGGLLSALGEAARAAGVGAKAAANGIRDSSKAARLDAATTVRAAQETLKAEAAKVSAARTAAKNASESVQTTGQDLADANQGVLDAARAVRDAQRGVADAIRQGAQAVRDAVAQADQNLFSIGASLSDSIGRFLDEQAKSQDALGGPNSAELKRLRAKILAGQGGPETRRAAQELAHDNQTAVASVEKRKARIQRDVADLVDEFNKGAITLAQFNRRLAGVLSREGITYKKAGKLLGIAFADGFEAELRGLRAQAAAIAAGPRRRGVTGLEPSIVRPLEALHQSQQQIADAIRTRGDAQLGVARAQRSLEASQDRHQAAILQATQANHRLETLQEEYARVALAESRAERRLARLSEQHLRFLREEARKQTALLRGIRDQGGVRPDDRPGQRGGPGPNASRRAREVGRILSL